MRSTPAYRQTNQKVEARLPWEKFGAIPEMLQTAWGSLFRSLTGFGANWNGDASRFAAQSRGQDGGTHLTEKSRLRSYEVMQKRFPVPRHFALRIPNRHQWCNRPLIPKRPGSELAGELPELLQREHRFSKRAALS
jgi:hypothetical protein